MTAGNRQEAAGNRDGKRSGTIARIVKRLLGRGGEDAAARQARGFASVKGVLDTDTKALRAGDISVQIVNGEILLGVGADFALILRPDAAYGQPIVRFQCYSTGGRIPQVVDVPSSSSLSSSAVEMPEHRKPEDEIESEDDSTPPYGADDEPIPLCVFGPGGDYSRPWPDGQAAGIRQQATGNDSLNAEGAAAC